MNPDQRLKTFDDLLMEPARRGLLLQTAEDEVLDGRTVTIEGRSLVNFGSCSYLGLEMDPRLREGVVDAVMRYGTQFSSSRTYLSAPLYREVEEILAELFGGPVVMTSSTTLGHIAALPVLISQHDAFQAMIDDRPYRRGRSVPEAVEELRRCAGSQFDPAIVDAFIAVISEPGVPDELPRAVLAQS